MLGELDFDTARDFGTALLLGALLGIEREKRNAREGGGIAGLRSFILLAQVGAVAGYLGHQLDTPWVLAAAVLAVAAVMIAGYLVVARTKPDQLGLTTELAALVTCLLGALVTAGHRELAIGLGVATAALLAYKDPLHQIVGRLHWDDVLVGLRLLLATFIVLPLLPDRAIDPWGALNPYTLWLLVLLISSVSLVGYVATRWLGPGHGTAVAGLAGGLVSSTAVTLTFAAQSRDRPAEGRQLAGGILLAWAMMYPRVLIVAVVVHPPLLLPLLAPLLGMGAVTTLVGLLCLRRREANETSADRVALKNPFSLLAAGRFALLFVVVQLLLRVAQAWYPGEGTFLVAGLAGTTEVDAVALSMAEQVKNGADGVGSGAAVLAIAIATASNTLVKAGIVLGLGNRSLRRPILVGTGAILATGALLLALR